MRYIWINNHIETKLFSCGYGEKAAFIWTDYICLATNEMNLNPGQQLRGY